MKDIVSLATAFALALSPSLASAAAIHNRASEDGCSNTHDWAGQTHSLDLESGGRTRKYLLHLPKNYKPGNKASLIIAYHGSGGDPESFEKTVKFSNDAINPDMVVAYPAGVNKNWQGPTYATEGVSDKDFTTDLINHLESTYCIDSSRIYAAGHSNGGGFVGTLACSTGHGGQFAAFAANSGAFYTDVTGNKNCTPARDLMPFMEIHGTADTVIPYEPTKEGRGGPLPKIPELMSRWAKRNGCGAGEKEAGTKKGIEHTSWECRGVKGATQHYKMDGHGHTWAEKADGVDGSRVMVDFFKQHKKF